MNVLRLEIGNIFIKDIQFGPETKVENGVLYVNKEELLKKLVEMKELASQLILI